MGRFSKTLEETRKKTNTRLAAEMDKFLGMSDVELFKMFPHTGDREEARKFIEKANKATSDNEKAQAIKEFVIALSQVGVRGVRGLVKVAGEVAKAAIVFLVVLSPAQAIVWNSDNADPLILARAETVQPAEAVKLDPESYTFGDFMAEKAKETKALYTVTWVDTADEKGKVRHAGGAYVPIHTGHSKDGKYDYFDWGLGFEEPQGSEKPRFIIPVMSNIIDISRRLLYGRFFRDHIRTTTLPKIWVGVIVYPPSKFSKRGLREYVFFQNVGFAVSAKFSSFLPEKVKP